MLKRAKIQVRKKKIIPERNEKQVAEAKSKCRVLTEKYHKKTWLLDDESYFTLSNSTLSGNDIYYSSNSAVTSSKVKLKGKPKYQQKLMVWLVISEKGISKPYIQRSGMAVNQKVYKDKCLRDRLISLIKRYHSKDPVLFWPDLASSHYAESVCDFLIENRIQFVEKYENPANVQPSFGHFLREGFM
ncbi:MAG: hypothetical protein ACIWVG_08205, partial [Gloeotrichia echinulata HAB0833]